MLLRRFIFTFAFCMLLATIPVQAAETQPAYCFSPADFYTEEHALTGICITDLPSENCTLRCRGRILSAGDVLTAEQLSSMEISTSSETCITARLSYLPVFSGEIGPADTLYISLRGTKNQPPTATDCATETYKNLSITEALKCSDPEGDPLTYELITKPKRGDVVLHADGTFTYTPKAEKVGKDAFVYQVKDADGNVSAEAKVTIQIRNTISSGVFADMTGDPNEREALFLRTNGLLSGESVAMTLCFHPDKPVSGEEFLMMAMKLTGLEPVSSDNAAEDWFEPWAAAALRAGIDTRRTATFTKQDAAVLTSQLLNLPGEASTAVFRNPEESAAAACLPALEDAGLSCFSENPGTVLTRRDAAILLYALSQYCQTNDVSFPWA